MKRSFVRLATILLPAILLFSLLVGRAAAAPARVICVAFDGGRHVSLQSPHQLPFDAPRYRAVLGTCPETALPSKRDRDLPIELWHGGVTPLVGLSTSARASYYGVRHVALGASRLSLVRVHVRLQI
jgi:hypothetical protein